MRSAFAPYVRARPAQATQWLMRNEHAAEWGGCQDSLCFWS
jgi:hypothetical protein